MYGFQPVNLSFTSITDVKAYHIVQSSGGKQYAGLATGDTLVLVGVNQADVLAGDNIGVCPFGVSRIVAGAAITAGVRITSNASGRAVAAGSGDVVIGYAREAAAADGDTIEAFILAINDKMIA
jgi:hypothetical protein